MKKIIFFHLLNDYSGSPKVLSQVIEAVSKKGVNVELFLGGASEAGFLTSVPCLQKRYFYKRFENKYLTLISYSLSQIILFFKLLAYRKSSSVFYVNTLLPFGAALAGKVLGIEVVYHIHETSIRPKPLKLFLRWVVARCSSKNVFVSNFLADAEGFSNIPSTVIYNSVPQNMSCVAAGHSYQPLPDGKFRVLMICSLKGYKGVAEFVQIASKLKNNHIIDFTLVVGASDSEVNDFFSGVTLPDNLTVISRCNDVIPYYQNTSVLLSLSKIEEWVETFGLTILEGISFGIPCIIPPMGGPTELVADGQQGYLIASSKIEEICDKLEFLQENPDVCIRLSKAAKIKSLDFSIDNFERDVLGVFDAV